MMVLVIGDRPSKCTDKDVPFKGARCEKRLMQWLDYLGVKYYSTVNQCMFTPSELQSYSKNFKATIALGNAASKAMGKVPHFKLPHPSGRNRLLNDDAYLQEKLYDASLYLSSKM